MLRTTHSALALACASTAFGLASFASAAITIPTNFGNGADSEIRESAPTSPRGTSSELATRVATGSRNSHMFMKFDVSQLTPSDLSNDIAVRLTVRNTNINSARINKLIDVPDPVDPTETIKFDTGVNNGLQYYVLDPTHTGANWDESTLTYENAPGMGGNVSGVSNAGADGDYATRDYNLAAGNLTILGTTLYRDVEAPLNRLLVGEAVDFNAPAGSPLHNAIFEALNTDHKTVTVVASELYAAGTSPDWNNFNYLFNPRDQLTLNSDSSSPYGGMSNTGQFSPQLVIIPEPASLGLLGIAAMIVGRRRSR